MILLLNCGSSKTPFIEEVIDEFDDFRTVPVLEFESSDLESVQGVIISGAPILVTEQLIQPYLDKLSWIPTTEIPVLGICFGHQLIGILHGSFASRMREDRDWQLIEVLEESPLFDRLPNEFEMMEDHCETISIPQNFKLTAASDACVNEAMQHESKPLYGVQFHPEISGNYGRTVLENFVRICHKK